MARTTSLAFPNMFNVAANRVHVLEDDASVVNRTRLLFLTEPTELYNEPTFGLGLKRYLWQYNNSNTVAMIHDRMKQQLKLFEPCVDPEATSFADGLLFTGSEHDYTQEYNQLNMTVGLSTIYGDKVEVNLNDQLS